MRFYNGSIKYDEILEMPYNLFMMFYEYMVYILNMETPEGQKKNRQLDNRVKLLNDPMKIDKDISNFKRMFMGDKKITIKK